jgi:hypothetical protein
VIIPPETRYARNGAIHLAYQVLGGGPPNLLVVQSGPNSHVDHNWMEPSLARFIRRLASFSRLVMYENRGIGLSDPAPGGEVRGIAVHTGARVAALAGAGEILVSRTIRDLVTGAPIQLESRGVHPLKGVPGSWEVFAFVS